MQVLAPCDPLEMKYATEWCANVSQSPTYMRLGKAGEPNLTENAIDKFEIGKIRYIKKGTDGEIYNIGPDKLTSIKKEVVERIVEKMNVNFNDAVEMSGDRIGQDSKCWLDCSKAKKELGWNMKIDWDQGLDEVQN